MGQLKNNPPSDDLQRLVALVRKFGTAMLVTHNSQGEPRARPMAIADIADSGDVWFVSRTDEKVDEIERDQRVLVALQSSSRYLSLSGQAEMIRDRARIEALWEESWRVWFRDKDDPSIVLIHVKPHEAEYWDESGLKGVKYLVKAAAAYATGKPLASSEQDREQHGKLKM